MTNEEKAVIKAARDMQELDDVQGWDALCRALDALDAAPAPVRRFWVNYHFTSRSSVGEGEGSAEIHENVPVTRAVLDHWAKDIARGGSLGDATVVIRTWTELEG